MKKILIILFFISCSKDFTNPRYKNPYSISWERKKIPIYKTGTYKNKLIKKEARKNMILKKAPENFHNYR